MLNFTLICIPDEDTSMLVETSLYIYYIVINVDIREQKYQLYIHTLERVYIICMCTRITCF